MSTNPTCPAALEGTTCLERLDPPVQGLCTHSYIWRDDNGAQVSFTLEDEGRAHGLRFNTGSIFRSIEAAAPAALNETRRFAAVELLRDLPTWLLTQDMTPTDVLKVERKWTEIKALILATEMAKASE